MTSWCHPTAHWLPYADATAPALHENLPSEAQMPYEQLVTEYYDASATDYLTEGAGNAAVDIAGELSNDVPPICDPVVLQPTMRADYVAPPQVLPSHAYNQTMVPVYPVNFNDTPPAAFQDVSAHGTYPFSVFAPSPQAGASSSYIAPSLISDSCAHTSTLHDAQYAYAPTSLDTRAHPSPWLDTQDASHSSHGTYPFLPSSVCAPLAQAEASSLYIAPYLINDPSSYIPAYDAQYAHASTLQDAQCAYESTSLETQHAHPSSSLDAQDASHSSHGTYPFLPYSAFAPSPQAEAPSSYIAPSLINDPTSYTSAQDAHASTSYDAQDAYASDPLDTQGAYLSPSLDVQDAPYSCPPQDACPSDMHRPPSPSLNAHHVSPAPSDDAQPSPSLDTQDAHSPPSLDAQDVHPSTSPSPNIQHVHPKSSPSRDAIAAARASRRIAPFPTPSPEPENPWDYYRISPRRNVQIDSSSSPSSSSPAAASPASSDRPENPWKCPHCAYIQHNHRGPDLRRHIATHSRQQWICCGLPLLEAAAAGVPDRVFADKNAVWTYAGEVMVGGCRWTFSRKDAFRRHLRKEEGRCWGDVEGAYQPENRLKANAEARGR